MKRNWRETKQKAQSVHREALKQNLLHRLEVARSQGNEKLISQLEAEASYLNL